MISGFNLKLFFADASRSSTSGQLVPRSSPSVLINYGLAALRLTRSPVLRLADRTGHAGAGTVVVWPSERRVGFADPAVVAAVFLAESRRLRLGGIHQGICLRCRDRTFGSATIDLEVKSAGHLLRCEDELPRLATPAA